MEKDLNLLNEFPPPTLEEWKKTVEDSLKGADFDRTMFIKTYEGITLKPIYTRADTEKLPFTDNQPGSAPYLRGNDPQRRLAEGWLIAQNHAGFGPQSPQRTASGGIEQRTDGGEPASETR